MKIVVLATENQKAILKSLHSMVNWHFVESHSSFLLEKNAFAYFNLYPTVTCNGYSDLEAPVFVNAVNATLKEMNCGKNVIRINGWEGFLEKDIWEIAGNISEEATAVLKKLNKKYIVVADELGLVTARIISMIINEAYFAKEDNISTASDMDIAMKLGTNYPFGPFEWAKIIGVNYIYDLLTKLSKTDSRYKPAANMQQEIDKHS
jgi:3-hydroxybutyryl-CoA dehydrogenase